MEEIVHSARVHRLIGSKPAGKRLNTAFYGLLLCFFFEYVRPGYYIPILTTLKLNTLIPLSVLFMTIFTHGIGKPLSLGSRNSKWLLFFFVLLTISMITSEVTFYSYNALKSVLGYLFLFLIIRAQVTDLHRLKLVMAVLAFSHLYIAFMNPNVVLQPEMRSYLQGLTFLGDGNDFALSVCIVLPFLIFLFLETDRKWKKIALLATIVLFVMCVIGTQSRGGSLALIAVLLYQWLKSKRKIFGLVVIVFVALFTLLYAPQRYFQRMETVANYQADGSALGRILSWKAAVRMACDNPLLGVGSGHFPIAFGTKYRPEGYGRTEIPWLTAHSIYFLVLGELGFPGILFLLGILISNILLCRKLERAGPEDNALPETARNRVCIALSSSLIAFSIGGAFLSALYYPHLYVLAALVDSVQSMNKKSASHPPRSIL